MNTGLLIALGVGAYLLYSMSQTSVATQSSGAIGPSVQAMQTAVTTQSIAPLAPPTGYVGCNPFGPIPYPDCKFYPAFGWFRP